MMIEHWPNNIFIYLFIIVSLAFVVSLFYIKSLRNKIELREIEINNKIINNNKLNNEKTTLELSENELRLFIDKKNMEIDILTRKNDLLNLFMDNNYLDRIRYAEQKIRIMRSTLLKLIEDNETDIKKSIRKKIKNICSMKLKNNKMTFFRSSKTTSIDVGKYLDGFKKIINLDKEIKDILEEIADEKAKGVKT